MAASPMSGAGYKIGWLWCSPSQIESNPAASARSHSRSVSSKLACPCSGLSPIFKSLQRCRRQKLFEAPFHVNVKEAAWSQRVALTLTRLALGDKKTNAKKGAFKNALLPSNNKTSLIARRVTNRKEV